MPSHLPALTPAQEAQVLAAMAPLRLRGQQQFLADLRARLALRPRPPSDLDLRVALRPLLGVVPVKNIRAAS
jgi:hypothetical protein